MSNALALRQAFDRVLPDRKKAIFFTRRLLSEFVCDAVNIEGIPYSLPEVQTLLGGITVGGKKISDQTITLNQAHAWNYLFTLVQSGEFSLSIEFACALHAIAGFEEALIWGQFRNSQVTIPGTKYTPPSASELERLWENMLVAIAGYDHILDRAFILFLTMARTQFFFDVNKRMGRFLMNGLLLNEGYPAINVPASRAAEFHSGMIAFYETNERATMVEFLTSCIDERVLDLMDKKQGE